MPMAILLALKASALVRHVVVLTIQTVTVMAWVMGRVKVQAVRVKTGIRLVMIHSKVC